MINPKEKQLITELSRRVVIKVAPEEQLTFNVVSQAYFKNPEKTLKGEGGKDDLLGFGVEEFALILTPIILEVVKEVLKELLKDSIKDTITKKSPTLLEKLKRFLRRLFRVNSPQLEQTLYVQTLLPLSRDNTLSKEQLIQVHKHAYETARELGVDAKKATLIADSVVASLQLPLQTSGDPYENEP
jgi:hypothetical protein